MARKRRRRVVLAVGGEAVELCKARVVPVTAGMLRMLGVADEDWLVRDLRYWCPECGALLAEPVHEKSKRHESTRAPSH